MIILSNKKAEWLWTFLEDSFYLFACLFCWVFLMCVNVPVETWTKLYWTKFRHIFFMIFGSSPKMIIVSEQKPIFLFPELFYCISVSSTFPHRCLNFLIMKMTDRFGVQLCLSQCICRQASWRGNAKSSL